MTKFILFTATAFALFFTACSKEQVIETPDNCYETLALGEYGSFVGTYQPTGGTLQTVPDAETRLKVSSVDCSRVLISILNTNIISFEANCTLNGSILTGVSDDGKGTFTLNTATKKIVVTYNDGSGTYSINAIKES